MYEKKMAEVNGEKQPDIEIELPEYNPEKEDLLEWMKTIVDKFGPHTFLVIKMAYQDYRKTFNITAFSNAILYAFYRLRTKVEDEKLKSECILKVMNYLKVAHRY